MTAGLTLWQPEGESKMQTDQKYVAWNNRILEDINSGVEDYIATLRAKSLELWETTSLGKFDITERQKKSLYEKIASYYVMLEDCLHRLEQFNNLRHTESMLSFSWMPSEAKRELMLAYLKEHNVIQGGK